MLSSISGIGGLGFDGTSSYGDYATMAMLGNSPYGMMGMSPMMGMGMMGMNPAFMGQMAEMQKYMAELQHQQERGQLAHAQDMHSLIQQAEVSQLSAHDRAIFEKAMVDGDVKEGIRTLANVIRTGDQDAICEQYDKLKVILYTKYSDYFETAGGKNNAFSNVNNFIRVLYAQIVGAQSGQVADLENDIKAYGETAFMHGFNKAFLGKKGHNEKYSEETVNYLFGTRINDKGSKDRTVKFGGYVGKGAEGLGAGLLGGAATIATVLGTKLLTGVNLGTSIKALKHWGRIGLALGLGADILWQMSRD